MKRWNSILVLVVLAVGLMVGCGKKEGVDTARLESSFSAGDAPGRNDVNAAVNHIRDGKYAEALGKLQQLAAEPKLTSAQQDAVKDAVQQIQEQLKAKVDEATTKVNEAAEELKKKLPFGK